MPDDYSTHWNNVWDGRDPATTSWYQAESTVSLRLIEAYSEIPNASIVDIGSGRSALIPRLLETGARAIEVLDISRSAVDAAAADLDWPVAVRFTAADVTTHRFDQAFDVWHDRAVFHFLITEEQRDGYREALLSGTRGGSIVVLSTFASDGPESCSGLPVCRYSSSDLAAEFPGFVLLHDEIDEHRKPDGETQRFQYVVLRRDSAVNSLPR
ncbi:MAG: class I SAM-dependent methyltransferase [Acidimicrobiales bacterium]